MKEFIKNLLIFFHIDLTKNIRNDRLTLKIISKKLTATSNGVDVGCHKGEILDYFLKYAPKGKHFAFEPIPELSKNLELKYSSRVKVFGCALSDENSKTTFQWVKNDPAYSGLRQRKYRTENNDIEEIEVDVKKLDDLIDKDTRIDLIKIDVEGAEFKVLKGAKSILLRDKPLVIFEFGLGASDYYDTSASEFHKFIFEECGLSIKTLPDYIKNKDALSKEEFVSVYESNKEYYFVAS